MKSLIAALALSLPACATTPAEEAPPAPAAASCRADRLGDLVGRPVSAALAEAALARSGARRLRWIRPGQMVTMDYSPDRLNIHLDAQGKVVRFACG
jgi:hypothetical protein